MSLPKGTWCYDLEIIKAIPERGMPPEPGIQYCGGWTDYIGMGISVLCMARPDGTEMHTFIGDPTVDIDVTDGILPLSALPDFIRDCDLMVGHYSDNFDRKVLGAKGIVIPHAKHMDFYTELAKAYGKMRPPKGYNLQDLSTRCGGPPKSGDGARAPHRWQQGDYSGVIAYCQNDILMTCAVAQHYIKHHAFPAPDGVMIPMPVTAFSRQAGDIRD